MKKLKPITPKRTAYALVDAAHERVVHLLELHGLENLPSGEWWFDALTDGLEPPPLSFQPPVGQADGRAQSVGAGAARPAAECHRLDLIELQSVLLRLRRAYRRRKGYKVYALLNEAMDLARELRIAPSDASGEEPMGIEHELIEQSDDLFSFVRSLFLLERAELPRELEIAPNSPDGPPDPDDDTPF